MEEVEVVLFKGYAQNAYDELVHIDVRREGVYLNIWEGDDIRDDLENDEDFIIAYGSVVYKTIKDFKEDKFISIRDIGIYGVTTDD